MPQPGRPYFSLRWSNVQRSGADFARAIRRRGHTTSPASRPPGTRLAPASQIPTRGWGGVGYAAGCRRVHGVVRCEARFPSCHLAKDRVSGRGVSPTFATNNPPNQAARPRSASEADDGVRGRDRARSCRNESTPKRPAPRGESIASWRASPIGEDFGVGPVRDAVFQVRRRPLVNGRRQRIRLARTSTRRPQSTQPRAAAPACERDQVRRLRGELSDRRSRD